MARRHSKGFTLVELIVVIVLMGLLSVVGANMISDTMRTSYITTNNHSSASQARYAMERLTREIREIAFGTGGYSISTMTATSLTFTKEDGTTVTVSSSGTSLSLGYSGGATSVLTDQLSSGTFALAYLDQLGGATTDKEELRFVQITLTIADQKTGKTESLRNRVFLRNAQKWP